jgi:hypothetical protein
MYECVSWKPQASSLCTRRMISRRIIMRQISKYYWYVLDNNRYWLSVSIRSMSVPCGLLAERSQTAGTSVFWKWQQYRSAPFFLAVYRERTVNKHTLHFVNPTFTGPCILIHCYSKTNQMHLFLTFIYFSITLYMFRAVFPSIIRSSKLYIQQQAYIKQILLSAC